MATIGELVKQYREQHNLSMDEFSRKCGVSKGYISMIEKGVTQRGDPINLTQDMMSALVRGMDSDFDEVFCKLDNDQKILVNTNTNNGFYGRISVYFEKLSPLYMDTVEKVLSDKRLLEFVKKICDLPEEYQEEIFKNVDYQIFLERKNGERTSVSSKVGWGQDNGFHV